MNQNNPQDFRTKKNPFHIDHTETLYKWQEAINLNSNKNISILNSIRTNKFLYPDDSEIRELKMESANLELLLGEVFEYEYKDYLKMFPEKTEIYNTKKFSDLIPIGGIVTGATIGWYVSVFKGSQNLFKFSRRKNFKDKYLWQFFLIFNICTIWDLINRLNYVGDEYQRLQFLKWCLEYRKNTALLEFTGTVKVYDEGGRYRFLNMQTSNSYSVIDHYSDLLGWTWNDHDEEIKAAEELRIQREKDKERMELYKQDKNKQKNQIEDQ